MNFGDRACPDCTRLTSGDCGMHTGTWMSTPIAGPPQAPTRDEVNRVRQLYQQWSEEPDQLTSYALVWQIPRLLARIEYLEGLLAERVS